MTCQVEDRGDTFRQEQSHRACGSAPLLGSGFAHIRHDTVVNTKFISRTSQRGAQGALQHYGPAASAAQSRSHLFPRLH